MIKVISLVLGLAIVACASFVHADVLVFDNFDYADGSLVPNGGWANHSVAARSCRSGVCLTGRSRLGQN